MPALGGRHGKDTKWRVFNRKSLFRDLEASCIPREPNLGTGVKNGDGFASQGLCGAPLS